jgi:hypothetical protein
MEEVTAALRGDVIPAPEIVEAIVRLHVERHGGRDSSRMYQNLQDEADILRSRALLSQNSSRNTPSSKNKRKQKRLRKGLYWATGIAGTAIISLIVTSIIPQVLGQVVNGAKIKDAIRRGPDVIIKEGLYYPYGGNITPVVIPGNYHPSSELVRALSKTGGMDSPVAKKQIGEADGVDLQDIFIRLILQGNRNEPVNILNVYPVNLRRTEPLNGVLFNIPGAQGEISNIKMNFNLDQLSPHALTVINNDVATNQPFFESHSISLVDGEQAVLVIQATTYCYDASFDLAVNYMVGGATHTDVVSNRGRPFQVSAYRVGKTSQLSYKQDFEIRWNYSAVPVNRQVTVPSSLFSACPQFGAPVGN